MGVHFPWADHTGLLFCLCLVRPSRGERALGSDDAEWKTLRAAGMAIPWLHGLCVWLLELTFQSIFSLRSQSVSAMCFDGSF